MNKDSKILYDRESNVLSIEIKHAKSVDSDIQGNMVIDYDKKGEVVRVNLYNFNFASFRDNVKNLKSFARSSKLPFLVR